MITHRVREFCVSFDESRNFSNLQGNMVTVAKLPKGHLDLTRKVLLELKQVFRLFDTDILKNRL